MGLCPVSAITQEPNENPIAFLERLKEALHIRIKLQQLQQQDPAASLDDIVQTAINIFYKKE